jgi:prepilin-type N-terminal cleavage/methylation domain-containing protein
MKKISLICGEQKGLTLLEVMITVGIFAFLSLLLAGLIKVAFDLWRGGERHGDIIERQQMILQYMENDFACIYAENETREVIKNIIKDDPMPDEISISEPSFYLDTDSSGNSWFYLTCTDSSRLYEKITDTDNQSKRIIRVLYYLSSNSSGSYDLHRVILDKANAFNLSKMPASPTGGPASFPESASTIIFNNVLYFRVNAKGDNVNSAIKWNSLPKNSATLAASSSENILVPEQTLPQAVEIEMVIKPMVFPKPPIVFKYEGSDQIGLSHIQGLPQPPDYIRIDNEWIGYSEINGNTIKISERPARFSHLEKHALNSPVLYGNTLKELIYLNTNAK